MAEPEFLCIYPEDCVSIKHKIGVPLHEDISELLCCHTQHAELDRKVCGIA